MRQRVEVKFVSEDEWIELVRKSKNLRIVSID